MNVIVFNIDEVNNLNDVDWDQIQVVPWRAKPTEQLVQIPLLKYVKQYGLMMLHEPRLR